MQLPSLKKSGDKSPIRKIKTLVTGVLAATLSFGAAAAPASAPISDASSILSSLQVEGQARVINLAPTEGENLLAAHYSHRSHSSHSSHRSHSSHSSHSSHYSYVY